MTTTNKPNLNTGINALMEGFRLVRQPSIRLFVLIPLSINFILFSALIWWSYGQISALNEYLLGYIPEFLSWLTWLLYPLFFLLVLVFLMYGFSMIANLIASPFNGFLAEKVEVHLTGKALDDPMTWKTMLMLIPRSVGRELRKILYYLPLLLVAIIITFFPGINFIAPLVWFLLNSWMMNIQYLDYPMDNHLLSFTDVKVTSQQNRFSSLGFGGSIMLFTMIPFANLVIMPVAVCGATALWVRHYDERKLLANDEA